MNETITSSDGSTARVPNKGIQNCEKAAQLARHMLRAQFESMVGTVSNTPAEELPNKYEMIKEMRRLANDQKESRINRPGPQPCPRIMHMTLDEIKNDSEIQAALGAQPESFVQVQGIRVGSKPVSQILSEWRKRIRQMAEYGASPFTQMVHLMGGPAHTHGATRCRCRACISAFTPREITAVQQWRDMQGFHMKDMVAFIERVQYLDQRYNGPRQACDPYTKEPAPDAALAPGQYNKLFGEGNSDVLATRTARRFATMDFDALEARVLAWLNGKTTDGQPTKEEVDKLVANGWDCEKAVAHKMKTARQAEVLMNGQLGRLDGVSITINGIEPRGWDEKAVFNDLKRLFSKQPLLTGRWNSDMTMERRGEAALEQARLDTEAFYAGKATRKQLKAERHGLTFGGTYAKEHKVKKRVYNNLLTTMPETMSGAMPFNLLNKGR